MQDKNKNKLVRESFSHFVDYKTTLHFFCKKTMNNEQHVFFYRIYNNAFHEMLYLTF